jgi:hypothetical protein
MFDQALNSHLACSGIATTEASNEAAATSSQTSGRSSPEPQS